MILIHLLEIIFFCRAKTTENLLKAALMDKAKEGQLLSPIFACLLGKVRKKL
jgi:hypothetical protein